MPNSAWECPSCGEANTVRTTLCSHAHHCCLALLEPACALLACGCKHNWVQIHMQHSCNRFVRHDVQSAAVAVSILTAYFLWATCKQRAPLCAPAATTTTTTTATFVYCQAEDGSSEAVDKEQQVERMGLTPDWIIQATAFKVFQLAPPTPEQPFIRGLLDPCTNSMLAPNIPAEKLYDKVVSFGEDFHQQPFIRGLPAVALHACHHL